MLVQTQFVRHLYDEIHVVYLSKHEALVLKKSPNLVVHLINMQILKNYPWPSMNYLFAISRSYDRIETTQYVISMVGALFLSC